MSGQSKEVIRLYGRRGAGRGGGRREVADVLCGTAFSREIGSTTGQAMNYLFALASANIPVS